MDARFYFGLGVSVRGGLRIWVPLDNPVRGTFKSGQSGLGVPLKVDNPVRGGLRFG